MHVRPVDRGREPLRVPERAAEIVRSLQVLRECPACGKRCYRTRANAKRAGRLLHPGRHVRRYRCDAGWWHLTSMREQPEYLSRPRRNRNRPQVPLPVSRAA